MAGCGSDEIRWCKVHKRCKSETATKPSFLDFDWTERDFAIRHVPHPIIGCPFTVTAAWLRCYVRAWVTVSKVETLPTNSAISRPRRPGIDSERPRWLSRTWGTGAVCWHTIFLGMHVVIWNACWHAWTYVPHVVMCNMHIYMSTCNTLTCQKHASWILNMLKKWLLNANNCLPSCQNSMHVDIFYMLRLLKCI